jgi:outer membrane immunogenic protein
MNMLKAKGYMLTGAAGAAIAPLMGLPLANAADLKLKAPPAPLPVAAPSWTGCYIGVNAGGASQRSDVDFSAVAEANFSAAVQDNHAGSFIAGGQIGCNYQTGMFVLGLEGDYSGLSKANGLYFAHPNETGSSYGSHISWMATIRGRVGVTFGDGMNLLYATGGVAFTKVNASAFEGPAINVSNDYSSSRSGWVVGGGFERMLTPNVIIGLEGLFADFGSHTTASDGAKCCSAIHNSVGIARGRLSFKF